MLAEVTEMQAAIATIVGCVVGAGGLMAKQRLGNGRSSPAPVTAAGDAQLSGRLTEYGERLASLEATVAADGQANRQSFQRLERTTDQIRDELRESNGRRCETCPGREK